MIFIKRNGTQQDSKIYIIHLLIHVDSLKSLIGFCELDVAFYQQNLGMTLSPAQFANSFQMYH